MTLVTIVIILGFVCLMKSDFREITLQTFYIYLLLKNNYQRKKFPVKKINLVSEKNIFLLF
jgi:hypothetical protein